jgi:hypothetical protein
LQDVSIADDFCHKYVMTLTLKYRQLFFDRLFANMPAAAREAYNAANAKIETRPVLLW